MYKINAEVGAVGDPPWVALDMKVNHGLNPQDLHAVLLLCIPERQSWDYVMA